MTFAGEDFGTISQAHDQLYHLAQYQDQYVDKGQCMMARGITVGALRCSDEIATSE